jgi:hypothetical protein
VATHTRINPTNSCKAATLILGNNPSSFREMFLIRVNFRNSYREAISIRSRDRLPHNPREFIRSRFSNLTRCRVIIHPESRLRFLLQVAYQA